jgi:hypothetical protein
MWKISRTRSYRVAALLVLAAAGFGAGRVLSAPAAEPAHVCSETCASVAGTRLTSVSSSGPRREAVAQANWSAGLPFDRIVGAVAVPRPMQHEQP